MTEKREGGHHSDNNLSADYIAPTLPALDNQDGESRSDQQRLVESALPCLGISVALVRQSEPRHYGPITLAADVFDLLRKEAATWDRERFLTLALDGTNRPIGIETVAIGSLGSCQVHPREVMKSLILANAASFIAIHNHPSGDLTPSEADKDVTRKLKEAGTLLGIRLLDHIILAQNGFYSFVDHQEL